MANVPVETNEKKGRATPLFKEIERRVADMRRRAFELFEGRGRGPGHALDDWLKAEHEIMGWPAAELSETDSGYELEITLPGYDAKEVHVTATSSEIIVHAQTESEKKGGKGKVVWTEYGSNDIYRRFEPPEPIDVEKTRATLEKGILHITAARIPAAGAKPVDIQAV